SLLAEMATRVAAVFWAPGFLMKRIIGMKVHLARFIMTITRKPIYRKSSGDNAPVIMGKSFFDDVVRIDPYPALASFTTPSLVIQGLADTDVRPMLTREAVSHMPRDEHHKLVEIDGATHNFAGEQLMEFISHTVGWFNKHLK
nr:alpha/beta hydrolase [Candidatus Sigynarchaeota archaeon]